MKRVLVAAFVVASVGAVVAAQAGCSEDNRGGSAGPYDTAGVSYQDIEVTAWTYGNFTGGPTSICSDGSIHQDPAAHGDFVVKRAGEVVCASTDPAFRITADPFGFGASITGSGENCSVAISLDGIVGTPGASASDVNVSAEGANAGARKDAPVKNHGEGGTSPSRVTLGDETIEIPNGTLGYFTKGARAQSEH